MGRGEATAGTAKHADESRSRPRNEVGEGRGDSRALKEQGADPDPFPAGLKEPRGSASARRRSSVPSGLRSARPSVRLAPSASHRCSSGCPSRCRLVVVSSAVLLASGPSAVRVRSAVLARFARPLVRSSPAALLRRPVRLRPASCPSSAPHPRHPFRALDCVVLPGVPSRRPLRVLPVIVTSSRALALVPLRVHPSTASCPLRVHPSTASCSAPDRIGPDPRSPVPGISPPPRRSSSRPDRHPAEGVSVRRIDGGPRHSYRPAVRVQCVPRIVAPGAAVRPAVSVRIALRFGADSRQHRGGAARRTLMRPQARRGTTVPTPHRRSRAIRVCPETDRAKPIRSRAGPPCGTEDR